MVYSAFPRGLQSTGIVQRIEPRISIVEDPMEHRIWIRIAAFATRQRPRPQWRARGGAAPTLAALAAAALVAGSIGIARAQDDTFSTNLRLLAALRHGDAVAIDRALHDGASVDFRNRLGETPLLAVLKKKRFDLAQALLDKGADVNEAAINGVTPLMAAAYAGNADFVRKLLDKGAVTSPVDRVGKNAMTYAAGEGHTDIVKLLLARGVDPNAVYSNNLTALMWAAGYGQTDTVRALLDAGARKDLVDNRGKTALEMASEFKHAQTVAVLQAAKPGN